MGNQCDCNGGREDQTEVILSDAGNSMQGVSEAYQFHETQLIKRNVKLNRYDRFYREYCAPLHLLDIRDFMT